MDNPSRSERTRKAAIQAALAIIARDGPGRLTLDAIARESGISKGGLLHQFRSKEAVLRALLEHEIEHFEDFSRAYLARHGGTRPQPQLAAEIATNREAVAKSQPISSAILAAVAEDPGLLARTRELAAKRLEAIKAEAEDPDLAVLRWMAARGMTTTAVLGMCPLSGEERERLFDRLLDDRQWSAPAKTGSAVAGLSRKRRKS